MKSKRYKWVNSTFFIHSVQYLIIAIFFCGPASAEFYRYVDENGNVVFTDNLNKVPMDQRDKIKSYEESETEPLPVEPKKAESPDTGKAETTDGFVKERQRLQEQETKLHQEYEDLMKMRSRLDKEKSAAATDAQIKEYNQQIIDFNQRIQAYEQKRDALADEINTFNDNVEKNLNNGTNNKGD